MTILVDPLRKHSKKRFTTVARRYADKRWCHMTSDQGEEELHDLARRVGLLTRWFQGDHYDLTEVKRALAVELGAEEVGSKELARRCYAGGSEG